MSERRLETFVRPLVVGIMMGCVALGVGELLRLIVPTWSPILFVVVCVLAAMEAQYSHGIVQARSQFHTSVWRARAVELGALFVVVRIASYIGVPWADVAQDIRAWPSDIARLLDAKTVTAYTLAFISWLVSTQAAQEMQQLDEPSALHPGVRPVVESASRLFFWGGALLLVVSGIARVGIAQLLQLSRAPVPGLVLNVIVYFGLGLFMLGQVRFASLHKVWREQRVEVGSGLAGRWVRYSLILLMTAGLLAFLLPTRYTMGLLDAIGTVVMIALTIVNFVYMLLMILLSLPFWLLSRLFSDLPGGSAPPPPMPLVPQATRENLLRGLSLSELARVLIFWLVACGVVGYVVWSYLADHPDLLRALTSVAPVRALLALWRALRRRFGRRQARRLGVARRQTPEERILERTRSPLRSWFAVRSPRDRVLYHYLGVLRRARRRGFPRRVPETPREYGQAIKPGVPEVQTEVEMLTAAFVEARYSRHVIESEQGAEARVWGQRIRSALRGRKLRRPPRGRGTG